MYDVAQSLRSDSSQLIVRMFVSPYLDAFFDACGDGDGDASNKTYVSKDDFFSLLKRFRKKEFGSARDDESPTPHAARYEDEVWKHILTMSDHFNKLLAEADAKRKKSKKHHPHRRDSEVSVDALQVAETPKDCVTFATLRTIAVVGDDVQITSAAQREALNVMLDDYVSRTDQSNITREEFVVELLRYKWDLPVLRQLDIESLAFYLFPQSDANVPILRKLIDMTQRPPIRNSFITDYTKTRLVRGADIRDLIWFVPFLVLYICVVMSGRGVTPRSYMGRGVVLGINTALDSVEFPTCSRDTNGSFTCDTTTLMSVDDISTADHVFGFLQGTLADTLWPVNGTGGETLISNSLRVTGALKLRQQRVKGISSVSDYPEEFYTPVYTPQTVRYPPYSPSALNTSDFAPANTFIRDRVLMPWDGSRFGTCSELNGTGTITGINKDIDCDGYAVIVPFNVSKSDFTGIVRALAGSGWILSDTRNIIVDTIIFHLDSVMFVKLQLLFEFQAGGAITVSRQLTPFFFHDSASQSVALNVFYYIFIVYLAVLIIRFALKQVFGGVLVELQQVKWVLMDLTCFVLFSVSVVMRVVWVVLGPPSDPVWQLDHYPHQYEYAALLYLAMTSIDGFNAIISILAMFRFTKFFSGLNSVVNTLQRSVVDGAVIAFLTAVLLFAFAICATIVWGDRLIGYQTVPTSALSLLLTFIGEFDYVPLHDEQPTFSFFFFGAFTLIAIATLLNMVVAVFSDSFDDEQQASFKDTSMTDILANNRHHMLDGWTIRSVIYCLEPVQLVVSFKNLLARNCCRKEVEMEPRFNLDGTERQATDVEKCEHKWACEFELDLEARYSYLSFNSSLMVDVLDTIQPSWKDRRHQPSVARRTQAAAYLLKLVDKYVALPGYCPNNVKDIAVSTSIYEYCKLLFGTYDYSLIMTLIVMVPQVKFGYSGVSSLKEAARSHKRWEEEVSRKAVRVEDLDMLALRVAAVKEQTKIRNEMRRRRNKQTRGPKDPTSATVVPSSSRSTFGRTMDSSTTAFELSLGRSFITAQPSATGARKDPRKSLRDFERLCDSMSYLDRRIFLGILACAQFKHFGKAATLTQERFVQIAEEMGDYPQETYPAELLYERLGIDSWKTREGVVTFPMSDVAAEFQEEFASQCLGFNFTHEEAVEFEEAIQEVLIAEMCNPGSGNGNINKSPRGIEMRAVGANDDSIFKVNREEFSEIWKKAKGLNPPEVTLARVENIFPDERIDLELFLHFCRGDPGSHQKRSFQSEFASRMARVSTFLTWSAFYIPFLVFVVAIALIKNSTEDNVHVGVGLRGSFAPSATTYNYNLGQVNTFLKTTVSGIWSGLPTEKAQPQNFMNYFIGSLRIRQIRVGSVSDAACNNVFSDFFGDSSSHALNFDDYSNPFVQNAYTLRVQRDFSKLILNDCFGAYDFGGRIEKDDMTIPTSVTNPLVQQAFKYRTTGGKDLAAHDATYTPAGYYMDMPFNLTTDEAKALINELTNASWLDAQTRMVVAEFAVFNNNLRLYSHARFGFEITSGGAFYPIRRLASVEKPRGVTSKEFIVIAVILWGLLAIYLSLFLADLISKIRDQMIRLKLSFVHSFINTVLNNIMLSLDVVVMVMAAVSWIWESVSLSSVDVASLGMGGQYPTSIESTLSQAANIKILQGVVIILAFIRFVHILSFNRRVNLLFETFRRAFNDLIAILVLFVISLVAFSIGAILLFGYLINDHFNIQNSFFDLFNTATGGNPSYPDLVVLRRQISVFYYMMYVAVAIIVLYNMVIAVLTGAFSEVKKDLFDPAEAEEVLRQAMNDRKELDERQGELRGDGIMAAIGRGCGAITDAIRRNILLRELYQLVAFFRNCGAGKLINKCRVGRTLWANQAKWWAAVDSSLPRQSCLAGINLLILEREVQFEQEELKGTVFANLAQSNTAKHPTNILENDNISVNGSRPHSRAGSHHNGEANDDGMLVVEPSENIQTELSLLPRFRSYGERRRLPLWQEFLYSKFRNDFLSVQQHIVEIPAYLLAQSQETIWLEVVEVEHYFRIDQSSYNVDTDGSPIEDLYWQMPSVRREREEGDESDSDKEEMARVAAVAGFAKDKPMHAALRTSVTPETSPNVSPFAPMRANDRQKSLTEGADDDAPNVINPVVRRSARDDYDEANNDAVASAAPPTATLYPNKEPMNTTGEFSPESSPHKTTTTAQNNTSAHTNWGPHSDEITIAAVTPTPDDEREHPNDVRRLDQGESREVNSHDPHQPKDEEEGAFFFARKSSVDVNAEDISGAPPLDIED